MTDRLRIDRDELFDPKVDEALARERSLTGNRRAPPEPISPLRALLLSSTFYLPVAAALAGFLVWLFLEPSITDEELVAGPVSLVEDHPLGTVDSDNDVVAFTVGSRQILALREHTWLEPSVDGQPAFASLDDIREGTPVEVCCVDPEDTTRLVAMAIRPLEAARAHDPPVDEPGSSLGMAFLFPLTAVSIALALVLAEGAASRNWLRAVERGLTGAGLTLVFSFLAYCPAGLFMSMAHLVLSDEDGVFVTVHTMSGVRVLGYTACRSLAWATIGAGLGFGLNLVRSTKVQLRNSVVGGTLGGALGGAFFDPVSRFLTSSSAFGGAELSRCVGLVAVGACVGYFVALVDRLARDAWLRVRTGPLAGKSFVIHRTPTTLGSSPRCDVYLFKDAEIDGEHAKIHKVGNRFEIEDQGTRTGTNVGGRPVRRQRLQSGDQIVLGGTVLEFEERNRETKGRER